MWFMYYYNQWQYNIIFLTFHEMDYFIEWMRHIHVLQIADWSADPPDPL